MSKPAYTWTIDKMVTEKRAARVARLLYPDEVYSGVNCRAEVGRVGQLCTVCIDREESWKARVLQVREAMKEAFS